ncbi:MAG: hypothetical protein HW421_2076 [Ignavibacteria bacterium]|nr:hypothetical protein [Ignavibacteria bacterium]
MILDELLQEKYQAQEKLEKMSGSDIRTYYENVQAIYAEIIAKSEKENTIIVEKTSISDK